MGKDAYFFSHDANARNDPKMLAMRSVYGAEGYAWYFMLLEIMREQSNYKIPLNKYTFHTLAMQLQCERNALEKHVKDCCDAFADANGTLLCRDEHFIWSESFLRRMAEIDRKRDQNRNAAFTKWSKEKGQEYDDANAMQPQSDGNAGVMQGKESKGSKGSKGKDNGKSPYGSEKLILLTEVEYVKLVDKFGKEGADKKIESMTLGIMAKGYKYTSHYAAILNWDRMDQDRKPSQPTPPLKRLN
jgi:hypothetical protein